MKAKEGSEMKGKREHFKDREKAVQVYRALQAQQDDEDASIQITDFQTLGVAREERMANLVAQHSMICDEASALFERKNREYGDSISEFGMLGAVLNLRANSKRLRFLVNDLPKDPSNWGDKKKVMRDIGIDLLNYSAIFLIFLNEGNVAGKGE